MKVQIEGFAVEASDVTVTLIGDNPDTVAHDARLLIECAERGDGEIVYNSIGPVLRRLDRRFSVDVSLSDRDSMRCETFGEEPIREPVEGGR